MAISKNAKTALVVAGIGIAGFFAVKAMQKAGVIGGGSGTSEGSLGGSDEIPYGDGPLAVGSGGGYVYPDATGYEAIDLLNAYNEGLAAGAGDGDGTLPFFTETSYVPLDPLDPRTPIPQDLPLYNEPSSTSPEWWNNPWVWAGAIGAAELAVFGTKEAYSAYKAKKASQLTGLGELKTSGGMARAEIKAVDSVNLAKTSGKASDLTQAERLIGKTRRVPGQAAEASKVAKGAELARLTGRVETVGNAAIDTARIGRAAESAGAASKVSKFGRVASTAGKIGVVAGGVIDTALIGYNIYDYERQYKGQDLSVKEHAGLAVAGVAKTGEQTVDPLFSLIYRPKRVAEELGYENSGWFAGEKAIAGFFKDMFHPSASAPAAARVEEARAFMVQSGVVNVKPEVLQPTVSRDVKSSGKSSSGSSVTTPKIVSYGAKTSKAALDVGEDIKKSGAQTAGDYFRYVQSSAASTAAKVAATTPKSSGGGSSSSSSSKSTSSSSSSSSSKSTSSSSSKNRQVANKSGSNKSSYGASSWGKGTGKSGKY